MRRILQPLGTFIWLIMLACELHAAVITESFEGYYPGANIPVSVADSVFLVPGVSSPFTFTQSGVTLTSPIPNPNSTDVTGEVLIGDFSRGHAEWNLRLNGIVEVNDVPDGQAYLASADFDPFFLTLALPSPASSVSAAVDSCRGGSSPSCNDLITIRAYDAKNNLLATQMLHGVSVANWAANVFTINAADIMSIQVQGSFVVLDQLQFTTADTRAPEPMTLLLLPGGLAVFALVRRRVSRAR